MCCNNSSRAETWFIRRVPSALYTLAVPYKVCFALLLLVQLAFATQEVAAPRVKVIFDDPAETAYAERVAAEAEGALDVLIPLFGYAPPPITLRLESTTDVYNALASPLPRPSVGVRQLFPTEVSLGYRAGDELRLLLIHELTHIMQFGYLTGRGTGLKLGLVGENVANVPPAWLVEGLAVWDESEFTAGGRRDDALTRGLVQSAVLAGTAPSLTDASLRTYGVWPGSQTQYLFGVGFTSYLIRRHGFDAIKKALALHNAAGFIRPFEGSWQLAVGTDLAAEWRAWQREVLEQAKARAQKVTQTERAGTLRTDSGWYTHAPALSPDGRQLAWVGWPARVMLADVDKNVDKNADGGALTRKRVLLDNRLPGSLEWSDAHTLLYARPVRRPSHTYSEIFTLDTRTGRETQLTAGARAHLPAPLPGGCVLYVTDDGTRSKLEQLCPGAPAMTRWQGNPGVHVVGLATSCRGQVAISVWQRGWVDLALLENGTLRYLTRDPAQDLEPSWKGEGALLFRSDRTRVFELYELRLSNRRLARLSQSVGGAFTPEAGLGGTWFTALGGRGYNLAWLGDAPPPAQTQASVTRRPTPPLRVPEFPVFPYNPLDSLGFYGWLPTNAGVNLSPLGTFLELSAIAQDDSLDHNLRTTLGFDSGLTALSGFYGFARYDFGGGLALQATPPPLRYAAQVGAWPLAPHLSGTLTTVSGAKVAVTARLPEDRLLVSGGLEAGLVHFLGQSSGFVLDARAEGALSAGQLDTWGYRTEGWRVSGTGLLSATGAAPSLGAWGDGSYTLPLDTLPLEGPLSALGRLEFGVRAGYRPAWPVPLKADADLAALVSVGSSRSFPFKLRVGDGLYALERVTLEPRLRTWLDGALHLGGDLTVSLDSVINYGAPVSLSGTLGYSNGVWTRFAVRLPL